MPFIASGMDEIVAPMKAGEKKSVKIAAEKLYGPSILSSTGNLEAMQNGIAIKPDSEESKALEVSISRAYAELERRAQKKSDPQPIGKAEQLPQKPELEARSQKIESKAPKQKQPAQLRSEPRQPERQPGLLEQVINLVAPAASPEQIIEIEIDGEIECYGLEELRDKARTWFTQTAEGAAIQGKGKLEKSVQYRRLCAVVPNWETFYGYKPKVQDLHRRHNLHGEAVKNAAIRLLQILTQ